jgi:putative chitobiose transport system substrate-binding protein
MRLKAAVADGVEHGMFHQCLGRWVFTCWLIVCAGFLGGCSKEINSEVQRLEVWTLALSPYFDDYLTDLFDEFERTYRDPATHESVEVVWVDVPFDAVNRKLVAAAAAGRAPDVINLSDRDFARIAALGGLADIDDTLPAGTLENYLPGAVQGLAFGDELLAVPWYLTTSVRMADRRQLAAGGLSPEGLADDWAGLRAQAREYHTATGGFLFSLPLGENSDLPMMMLAEGRVPFREVEGAGGPRLVADLTRPEVVDYVRGWVELYRDGVLPRAAATRDHSHLVELYQNEQLAVVQTGGNMLNRIADANPPLLARTAVLPGLTGALGRSHIAAMVVGVSRSSAHPEAAAALAAFLTSPKNQLELAKRSGVLPSTAASLDDAYFTDVPRTLSVEATPEQRLAYAKSISVASLPGAVAFTPALEAWPDLRRAFNAGMKRMLLDGADVAATLGEVNAEWDALLRAARPATAEALPRVGAAR